MKKQVIIINGSGGVGKDTFVEFCSKYGKVRNISSVDRVKMAAAQLGWDGGKTEKDRKFLSDLKLLTTEYNDHSYNYIKDCIDTFRNYDNYNMLFIHLREPEEIERVRHDFDCITLLITNKNVQGISSNMADANVSKYKYQFEIHNDGTLRELEAKAAYFVGNIL